MAKIQHAGGRTDKAKAVATAAFLGDSGRILRTVAACGDKATLPLRCRPALDGDHCEKSAEISTAFLDRSLASCQDRVPISQRSAAPVFCKARGAPSVLPPRKSPRGWSAERRNHQPTPCGAAPVAHGRPPLSAPSRRFWASGPWLPGLGRPALHRPEHEAFAPLVLPRSAH